MQKDNFKILLEVISGSHLYGTNHPDSDLDTRGVVLPHTIEELLDPFENFEQQVETAEKDRTMFNLPRFFKLAHDGNPNIVELLFVNKEKIININPQGEYLMSKAELFLSQEIKKTFMGYATSQLHRIKLHRGYLLNPPKGKPSREDFGLPHTPEFSGDKLNSILHAPEETISEGWREYARKEQAYKRASDEWSKYMQWMNGRNPKRFEYEKKFGYDLKHANHLFRLLFEGIELMSTGRITFPLKQAGFLKRILSGEFSYEKLMVLLEGLTCEFDETKTILPKRPDKDALREVYYSIVFEDF